MLAPQLCIDLNGLSLARNLPETLARLASMGYKAVAVSDPLPSDAKGTSIAAVELRAMLETAGLAACAVRSKCDSLSLDPVGLNTEAWDRCLAHALALEVRELWLGGGIVPIEERERTERGVMPQAVSFWKRYAGRALDAGLRLLIDPRGLSEWTPTRLAQVLRGVDEPNFGLVFDTGMMESLALASGYESLVCGKPFRGALGLVEFFKGDIGALILSEPETTSAAKTNGQQALGAGSLDWSRLIPALIDAWPPSTWWTVRCGDQNKLAAESARFFQSRVVPSFADAVTPV